jgi:hypothetical protein
MKKIFLFAAAALAALTINAKELDLATAGTAIGDWTVVDATQNASESDASKSKYVYDIKQSVPATVNVTAEPNVLFSIKNDTGDKAKAFVIYPGKCFEYGGKNGILVIKGTAAGDVIKLTVAAKGSNAADFKDPEGTYPKNAIAVSADLTLPKKDKEKAGTGDYDAEGYAWKVLEYQALGGDVEIKEIAAGYRINKIEFGGTQAIDNVNADVKAVKTFENGQLVIIKNGVRYNALGAQF